MDYQDEECLFCEEVWWGTAHPAQILFSGSRYLGKDCPSLESQLKQLFILRRILDIPLEWCEEKLGESEGDNPSNWFGICGGCTPIVEEAVDVHHKILKLEGKFKELKGKVKEKLGSGRRRRRKVRREGDGKESIKEEIRKMVVGERVIVKSEVDKLTCNYAELEDENDLDFQQDEENSYSDPEWNQEGTAGMEEDNTISRRGRRVKKPNTYAEFCDEDDEDDDDFNYQDDDEEDSCSDPVWNEGESSRIEMEEFGNVNQSQSDLPKIRKRKGPGRPPRGEERPRDLYITKDGKVRRFTFHWLNCSKCPARYKHQEDLNAHTSLHDSPTNHPCPECHFPCKNKDELERHHKRKHENSTSSHTPRYGCIFEDCQFSTNSRTHLGSHCRKEHSSMTPSELQRMRCPPCSKTFRHKKSLIDHQHRVHPVLFGLAPLISSTSGLIQCDQCSLSFTSRGSLEDHIRNTHERVQRHICEECGKGFKFKSRLDAHMLVHRKEREFVCHHCGLDYPAKYTLVEHIRKVHSENSAANIATKEEGGGGDSGEVFTCKYCELTSPFKVVIRRHQLTHKVEMGHQCDICQKCYTSDSGLRRHVRINHPTQEEVVECTYCRKPFGSKDYMIDHVRKFCQVKKGLEAGVGKEENKG